MSESAPSYSIAANLRWFAVLFLVSSLAAWFVASVLALRVPNPALALAAMFGAFAFAAWTASDRFADRRGADVRRRRADLAIGYVAVATSITLALPIVMAFLMVGPSGFSPAATHHFVGAVFGAVGAAFVGMIVNYIVAWLIIGRRRAGEGTTT